MANTYLELELIAKMSLLRLIENLVMPKLVYLGYSGTFKKKGAVIQIPKPVTFEAEDFVTTINKQDITEESVNLTMDTLLDVSAGVSSEELALNIESFMELVGEGAMVALAEKINQRMLQLYKKIPSFSGVSGTTPDALADISGARKSLNLQKVPNKGRRAIWDVEADAKFTELDALVNADKAGSTEALREGSIGKVYGIDNYWTQEVATHTAGTFTAIATPVTDGSTAAGATSIIMDGGSGTETILEGDIFSITVGGVTTQYTATADATASSGEVTVPVYPAVPAIIATDTAVVFPDKTAFASTRNMVFHPNAIAFVAAALPLPSTGKSAYASFEGISLRVVQSYDQDTKSETLSFDILCGFDVIQPELATVVLG